MRERKAARQALELNARSGATSLKAIAAGLTEKGIATARGAVQIALRPCKNSGRQCQ
ncbi:hypothetical protein QA640_14805 [Bradyrhizobium sp. CB82]|uniref:hypothetical protein n=1 Tax=Bradyrhizobium sp. CB82 TaxID=3039159 RepID=UPI0024B20F5C|nr:hypothetical protein [Bradyrhizobium sp. CB82]WFU43593.1 hypothetical protein QA640_14805 [Bradyrhizobium sp. CB82]